MKKERDMILKHKNMKDVSIKVADWPRGYTPEEPCQATVWWVNLTKHIQTGKPFICSPKPETIWVKNHKDWEELPDIKF